MGQGHLLIVQNDKVHPRLSTAYTTGHGAIEDPGRQQTSGPDTRVEVHDFWCRVLISDFLHAIPCAAFTLMLS